MNRRSLLPVGLAVVGVAAVVVGVHQDALQVAPAYEGTIETGWGGPFNHEERLLARLGVLGVAGAAAAVRWKHLAAVPVVTGGVVLFYPLRAVLHWAERPGLYTEVQTHGGDPVRFVLGPEPFLLVAGGISLLAAGVVGWRSHAARGGVEAPPTA